MSPWSCEYEDGNEDDADDDQAAAQQVQDSDWVDDSHRP